MGDLSAEMDPRDLALHSHPVGDSCGQEDKDLQNVSPVETVESINSLIAELEEEDGTEPDPEDVTVGPGMEQPVPASIMATDHSQGLSDLQVDQAREKYGWNRLKQESTNNVLKFLMLFVGPVQVVMELSALLSAGLKDWIDFGVICGLLLLNAVVGFVQEYHAGNIVASLKETLALKAVVTRNGKKGEIKVHEVVPGDIVHLEDGTVVPADGVLVSEDALLQVDQSSITGESLAVDKHAGDVCYSSSVVKRGESLMIATATGDQTYVGKAAALVSEASNGPGHFTMVLNGISMILLILVIFTLLIVWIANFYRSNPIRQILEFTLAITIVGVPVGLPAVVTTTMAVGAAYLAKKLAIVQKLSAIESLAGVEILCSDKTGTLTRNKLTLGEPYLCTGCSKDDAMLTACLASSRKKKALDAIDRVFVKALKNYPLVVKIIGTYKLIEFQPFDPVSKKVTAVVESPLGEQIICVKGAPKSVLRGIQDVQTVPDEIVEQYQVAVNGFASRGFRALGVARKRQDQPWEATALGLIIKMLTGDAVGIARETARQLGLGSNIYNAERLGITGAGEMPGSEVNDFVEAADGFAEVFPQHKYNVVDILQQRGYLVAMTGDGVNDAPSLKKADTGIAVEGASDAARSAADIVFLAPGLSAIIDAIKTSRQIFHRMYSYVVYRIALSLHLEIFFGLWIVIKNETLDIRLVVLLAIFADIATLAIAYDNAPYSASPVKWNTPRLWGIAIILGIVLGAGSWITLGTMMVQGEQGGVVQNYGNRDSVLFLEIALTQNWLIFITRLNGPIWKSWPSMQLTLAVLAVDITATAMCAVGAFVHQKTNIVALVRIWVLSFGVEIVCAVVYTMLQNSTTFDDLMHGRTWRRRARERGLEDFVVMMQRVSNQHEKTS
ncbi:plasma-membrane proton-efflux P-type ATPase [Penicillium capsulatum]|uniref:P-type H(+)-exporting transporter n=1 Tax=Penicillium capsulatum TaxID=69766 RepID=A0A9W9IHS4_9EURO|nr:plasma-membrane proton-efflux P-type ATPase [Penicillium capsulatum]KAJ6123380.1 plasma-membrane proton-efflux P-type ATPase [Penicillium capsulatum]